MPVNKRFFFYILIFLVSNATAQQEDQEIPLEAIFKLVEEKHQVTFTYADKNIESIFIQPPNMELDLSSILQYLEKRSGLTLRQLNDRFIAVIKPELTDGACGMLRDATTGEVISGAIIKTTTNMTVADENGYFKLYSALQDTITVNHLAYQPVIIPARPLNIQPCQKIFLEQLTTTLNEVIVSNFIAEGIDKKVDGSFIMSPENMAILPGLTEPDVLQTVQALPGIHSLNETVSDINVRGGTNDQNLVLWNGIKMYQSGHFFGLISAFNPYLIRDVNLIKNGTSAALGDGVSSTIDIRTHDHPDSEVAGGAGVNLINADAFLKLPLSKKTSIHFAARRSVADIIRTPTYQRYFERIFSNTDVASKATTDQVLGSDENFYFYDLSMKMISNIGKNGKLRLNLLSIKNKIEYEESAVIDSRLQSKTSSLYQGSFASGVSYSKLWNDNKIQTAAELYLSSYKLGAVNVDILKDRQLTQENNVLDLGAKVHGRISINNNLDVLTGYQFYEIGSANIEEVNKPSFRRDIKEVLKIHAAFTEASFTSNSEKTNLRVGIRSNYLPDFDKLNVEPRITFNQKLVKHFFVEILAEMKSQVISQIVDFQGDFLGVEKRRWVLSNNQDIPVIESKQISAGVSYDRRSFLLSIDGYYKEVEGIISSSQGFQNQYQFIRSTGSYEIAGFDFLVNKKFKPFNTWASYSFAQNTFGFTSFSPPDFPANLDIRHIVTCGITYEVKRLQVSIGANWRTGKPFTRPLAMGSTIDGEIIYNAPNTSRLGDYLRVDFSSTYNFPIRKVIDVQIGISLWNIFNKENIVNTYFQVGENGTLREIDQTSLALTPNFFVRVAF